MAKFLPRVCVIGAGPSGLITMKKLQDRGISFDCYEKGAKVGGLWVYDEKSETSACYKSLHINTSRKTMEFACYPMPEDYPTYCHNKDIVAYFDSFADFYDLKSKIFFNQKITQARRLDDGLWRIETESGEVRLYDSLVVANGHHWDPRWPEPGFSGSFSGIEMHSHQYKDPVTPFDLKGKKVVVVGMGNSAMDIACELGAKGQADKVFLSVRRGTHILPKYFGSTPPDSLVRLPSKKPSILEQLLPDGALTKILYPLIHLRTKLAVGNPEDFGLPKPKHKFGETHPTISNEIHVRLGSGDVLPKPNIKDLAGNQVRFEDGSCEEIDAIIYATGYKISFPFFDTGFLDTSDNDVALYKRIMDPEYNNLFFIGLVQPLCSLMPIAEVQAEFVSKYLTGEYCLPTKDEMRSEIKHMHQTMKKRYVASKRHTIQIECMDYTRDLYLEGKRGAIRSDTRVARPPLEKLSKILAGKLASYSEEEGKGGWVDEYRRKERKDEGHKPSGDSGFGSTDFSEVRL